VGEYDYSENIRMTTLFRIYINSGEEKYFIPLILLFEPFAFFEKSTLYVFYFSLFEYLSVLRHSTLLFFCYCKLINDKQMLKELFWEI